MVYSLNEKEILILSELRRNSRQSLAEISRKINIPLSTIFDNLRRLEEKLITKHTSLIDFPKLGFNIKVVLLLKTSKKDELKKFLVNHKSTNMIHKTNNYDYFVEAIFKDMGEFHSFLEDLENFNIEKKEHYYVEEEVKREEFSQININS